MLEHTAGKIRLYKTPNSSLKGQMKYLVTNDNDENKCHSELVEETTASRALLKLNDTLVESSERSSSRALIKSRSTHLNKPCRRLRTYFGRRL